MNPCLPSRELLQRQAEWLSEARSRMLRLAEIARRKRVLDLGSGYGWITKELRRRTSGVVIALDLSRQALQSVAPAVCADARKIPFGDQSFELVFSQNLLMWVNDPTNVIQEVARILASGGVWVLFEPDYKAMIEYPPEIETSDLWISALKRAGADPQMGRKLPFLLSKAGFHVRTELLPRVVPPQPERFLFLSELELTSDEERRLAQVERFSRHLPQQEQVSHLPYFLIIAERH